MPSNKDNEDCEHGAVDCDKCESGPYSPDGICHHCVHEPYRYCYYRKKK